MRVSYYAMKRLALAGALVACSSTSPRPPPPPPPTPPTPPTPRAGYQPDAAFAALFVDGATWPLDVVVTDSVWDEEDPKADAEGWVRTTTTARGSCHVAKVFPGEHSVSSWIDCDYGVPLRRESDPVRGTWAADDRGIHWDWLTEPTDAGYVPGPDDDPRFALPLAASREGGGGVEGGELWIEISQKGDGWCASYDDTMGSHLWQAVCIAPDGITEGVWGEISQAWGVEVRFTRAR